MFLNLVKKVTFLIIALTFFQVSLVNANVSLKNGNFFIGYTDILYPGGFEPKIERVYNSKTPYKGIFGWGWGNQYEVYLKVEADGSVVVHEYGGGAENRFSPVKFDQKKLDKAINNIAKAAMKAGAVGTKGQMSGYKKRLKTDANFRYDEWNKYLKLGRVKPIQLKEGTQLHSNRFSYQYITKVKNGYIRKYDNGKVERFSANGRLTQVQDKNSNFIKLSYSKDGHIKKISDNFNRKMIFEFNNKGLVKAILGENGKRSSYKYNASDELISTKDTDGNTYKHKYDPKGRHNMVGITYDDKTTLEMGFYPVGDLHENVKFVKNRDGSKTEYSYKYDKSQKGHFTVFTKLKNKDNKLISKSSYEYFMKYKPTGEKWTYKMATDVDGDRTETVYNECCGLPLMIRRAGQETAFQYDKKGHVVKKTTPTEITKLSYDQKAGKVSKVSRYSKLKKKQVHWSEFKYDNKGNLIFAKNSDKKGVKLIYDKFGRIQTMVDQNRRRIDFEYNENSKPILIKDPKLGTIKVSYTNSGEIKKVESSAGRKIALQVTSAFQNLLDIIRPAGVSLSF